MVELRPYQKDVLNDKAIVDILYWLIGKRDRPENTAALVVSPTGSGKTAMFAAISKWCKEHNLRVLILTHRREILEQTLKALFRLGITAGQIQAGRPMTGDLIQVASVQTLANRLGQIWRPDIIMSDECFPAGSLVGNKKIENLSIDDSVDSFNHRAKKIERRKILSVFKRDYHGSWFRVTMEDGSSFVSTEGHPIFTDKYGYISVGSLFYHGDYDTIKHHETMPNMRECNSRTKGSAQRQGATKAKVLLSSMLCYWKGIKKSYKVSEADGMRGMRKRCFISIYGIIQRSQTAWEGLPCGMPKDIQGKDKFLKNVSNKSEKKRSFISTNEREESYGESGNQGENGRIDEGKNIFVTWRKWLSNKATTCIALCNWVANGTPHTDSHGDGDTSKPSYLLQSGPCRSGNETGDRGGWENAPFEKMGFSGQEKDGGFVLSRVESIEIFERGSGPRPGWVPESNTVYNLHVEGNENYFVSGILVHNCHHDTVENGRGKILKFFDSVPRIGWTATPARTDGVGLRQLYDVMIQGKSPKWLVDEGYLTMPLIYQPPGMVTEKYHVTRGDFDAKEQEAVMSRKAIIGNVIDHYKKYLNGAPTIVSCVSIEHARLMAEQYESAGFRSRVVWGNMPTADRVDALEGLGTGKYSVVTFADLIGEGVDIPVCTGLQMLRLTQSLVLDLQFIGRVLRPIYRPGADLSTAEGRKEAIATGGKPFAIVLDHVGNTTPDMHGHPLADREWSLDSQKRPRGEKGPTTTTCPACYGVWPGRIQRCPSCGHSFRLAEMEAKKLELLEIEGELVQAGIDQSEADSLAQMIARANALSGADKQRLILGQAFSLMSGHEDAETRKRKVAALAAAVGYKRGWTEMVWDLKTKKERGRV